MEARRYRAVRDGARVDPQRCVDVDCRKYLNGFASTIDENTPLGMAQADYIRYSSRRRYREERTPEGLTRFVFPPGQACFTTHRPPALHVVGRQGVIRRHTRAIDWMEDLYGYESDAR